MLRKMADVLPSGQVVSLAATATVLEAARLMKTKHCGAVLVLEGNKLQGIFTERDVVNRVVAGDRAPEATPLSEVMTSEPDMIDAKAYAMTGLQMMEDGHYRHLPVVQDGRIIGVVSRRDFFGEEKAELDRERHYFEHAL